MRLFAAAYEALGLIPNDSEQQEVKMFKRIMSTFNPIWIRKQRWLIRQAYLFFWERPVGASFLACVDKTQKVYRERKAIADMFDALKKQENPIFLLERLYFKAKKLQALEKELCMMRVDAISDLFETLIKLMLLFLFFQNQHLLGVLIVFCDACVFVCLKALFSSARAEVIFALIQKLEASGIAIDLKRGERLVCENTLITQLIAARDNASLLGDIDMDLPDEFICGITHEVMTDPVYSDDAAMRFERLAILAWLKSHDTHPATNGYLCPEVLRRDFKLKAQIDTYVDNAHGFFSKKQSNGDNTREFNFPKTRA